MHSEFEINLQLKKNPWVDSHFHLTSVQDFQVYHHSFQTLDGFMFGGIDPQDWDQQLNLKKQFPGVLELCFGVHPEWLAQKDLELQDRQKLEEQIQLSLDLLAQKAHLVTALGEMGLDFRPHILRELESLQRDVFLQQLEIAGFAGKPVVLHLVRCHQEVLDIFGHWGAPQNGGLVHAFNGSAKKAEDFLKLGLYLSIGGSLVYKDSPQLQQAILEIPMDRILIESDAVPGKNPANLFLVAEAIGKIKKISVEEVLNQAGLNFYRLIGKGQTLGAK